MKRFFLLVFLLAVSSVFAVTPAEVAAYRKAAEQGDAKAQYNLGVCYANGDGVQKDLTQAVFWYRKAAEQGHAEAQYNLGVCYYNGDGVQKDLAQAVFWLRKAADQGFAQVHEVLKILNVSK